MRLAAVALSALTIAAAAAAAAQPGPAVAPGSGTANSGTQSAVGAGGNGNLAQAAPGTTAAVDPAAPFGSVDASPVISGKATVTSLIATLSDAQKNDLNNRCAAVNDVSNAPKYSLATQDFCHSYVTASWGANTAIPAATASANNGPTQSGNANGAAQGGAGGAVGGPTGAIGGGAGGTGSPASTATGANP